MRVSLSPPAPVTRPAAKAELQAATTAFEAMMLKHFLQSALPPPDGASGDWHAMALDGLAQDLAAHQPFGLARLLETNE